MNTQANRRLPRRALIVFAVIYLIIGALYAIHTPAWQVPDEPAHYGYTRQIVEQGCCPVMRDELSYENHQPPLYYLLSVPVYAVSNGNLIALRLYSVLLGLGAVIAGWATIRVLFPEQPWLAVGVAAFIAFLPQRLAMMGGFNNDSLTELLSGAALLTCALYVKVDQRELPRLGLGMGVLLGLIFLTKLTAYPLAAVMLLAVVLRARRECWPLRLVLVNAARILVPALAMGGILWLRNLTIYGWPDFLAQRAHDTIATTQLSFAQYIEQFGAGRWAQEILRVTFQSFWGQFGWMAVPFQEWVYVLLRLLTILCLAGAILAGILWGGELRPSQREALILFGVALALILVAFLYYNLKFVQFQGRYLYPVLIPIALALVGGLWAWVRLLFSQRAARMAALVPAVMLVFSAGMSAFAVYSLYRVLIPALVK